MDSETTKAAELDSEVAWWNQGALLVERIELQGNPRIIPGRRNTRCSPYWPGVVFNPAIHVHHMQQ